MTSLQKTSITKERDVSVPVPTPVQLEWHEQERIMFVCLDPCTWQGREYDNHSSSLDLMKMENLDTDQFCEVAQSWGAKEILFVAKHTGGFCWWQTKTTDYSVKSIPWKEGKGDLLVDVAKSCGKYGLNMGIYVYPGDENWGAGIGSGGKTRDPSKQEEYNQIFRQQLREAITFAVAHTKVIEVWFDGSCIIEVGDILKECAPNATILQGPHTTLRWVGNESGKLARENAWSTLSCENLHTGLSTQKESDPNGDCWAPLEVDVTLYDHNWFWAQKNEKKRKSLVELMRIYYESAGRGAVMLLNSTPNTKGVIPSDDVTMYQALGDEIKKRFNNPLKFNQGQNLTQEDLFLDLGIKKKVNHAIISENIQHGERVRKYILEGWTGKKWKKLVEGAHVGRKCILPFKTVKISQVRLRILETRGNTYLTFFGTYFVENFGRKRIKVKKSNNIKWIKCGQWEILECNSGATQLKLDLTPFITKVGTCQVRFNNMADSTQISQPVLFQAGQPSTPGILTRPNPNLPIFNLNRTAVITTDADIQLQLNIQGMPSKGDVEIKYNN
jgi:alpha-L-fucosidase